MSSSTIGLSGGYNVQTAVRELQYSGTWFATAPARHEQPCTSSLNVPPAVTAACVTLLLHPEREMSPCVTSKNEAQEGLQCATPSGTMQAPCIQSLAWKFYANAMQVPYMHCLAWECHSHRHAIPMHALTCRGTLWAAAQALPASLRAALSPWPSSWR